MKSTFFITNNRYLAATTVISIGVLGGCEYCLPLLMAVLSAWTWHFMKQASNSNCPDGVLSYNK